LYKTIVNLSNKLEEAKLAFNTNQFDNAILSIKVAIEIKTAAQWAKDTLENIPSDKLFNQMRVDINEITILAAKCIKGIDELVLEAIGNFKNSVENYFRQITVDIESAKNDNDPKILKSKVLQAINNVK
ncbi:hypothetical protein GR268_48405, partial [Rhizobium leguminosarum]|nr:hypothetical protein [Rhizobium leguminosarum]